MSYPKSDETNTSSTATGDVQLCDERRNIPDVDQSSNGSCKEALPPQPSDPSNPIPEKASPLENVQATGAATPTLQNRIRTTMIMSSFCLGGALVSMDSVIVSVALPAISSELKIDSTEYSWVGSSYLLAGAGSMPLWEPISSTIGRKPVLTVGLTLFFCGSALAAAAQNASMLIAGRTVQGIGEGAFTVMANVCMADLFALRERSLYIAMYAGASCVGAALAPLIGGALTQYAGWAWIFWINLPITAVTLALALIFLPFPLINISTWRELKRIDLGGIMLVTSGTIMMLLGLQFGGIFLPWKSGAVISLLAVGGITLVLFMFQQRRLKAARALIPFSIFHTRTGSACLAISFLHGFAYITALFYIPIYLELVLDVGVFGAGLWLLLTAVPTTIVTVVAALIIQYTGRYAMVTQVIAAALALGLGLAITFPSHRSLARIVIFQLILAVGIGPLFQAPLIGLQASVKKDDVSSAYATAIFMRTISSAIGLVIGQVIMSNELVLQSSGLLALGVPTPLIDAMQRDVTVIAGLDGLGTPVQRNAVKAAVTFALSRVWVACAVVAAVGFLASCFVRDLTLEEGSDGSQLANE